MAELKKCPFCGGEATLEKYRESDDGRMDKVARVKCKCGVEVHLAFSEFNRAKDDFGYKGGYYSQNKEFWDGMHQRLIDKWNNRPTESEIRAKAIDEFAEKLKAKIEEVYSAPESESEYNHAWKTVCRIIQGNMEVIAEQLKGE